MHAPLKGVDSREEFNSSSSSALGEQFWWLCVVSFLDPENASRRVGESAHAAYSGPWFSAKSQWYPIRALLLSFSSASSSMHGLFAHWREGDLTRPLFLHYVGSDSAAKYFSGAAPPSGGIGMPLRTTVVGETFIGEYIIKFNPTFTNTPVTWSPRGHGWTHGGSLCGATLSGLPGSSMTLPCVLPGDPGSSMVSPSPHGGFHGSSTDVLRNVRDVRSRLL